MNGPQKQLHRPCERVLDWIINHSEASELERRVAAEVRESGLNGPYQERVLSRACGCSGVRIECEYVEECAIGDLEWEVPHVPNAVHHSNGL